MQFIQVIGIQRAKQANSKQRNSEAVALFFGFDFDEPNRDNNREKAEKNKQ